MDDNKKKCIYRVILVYPAEEVFLSGQRQIIKNEKFVHLQSLIYNEFLGFPVIAWQYDINFDRIAILLDTEKVKFYAISYRNAIPWTTEENFVREIRERKDKGEII